jgi:hypothetical protein
MEALELDCKLLLCRGVLSGQKVKGWPRAIVDPAAGGPERFEYVGRHRRIIDANHRHGTGEQSLDKRRV